MSYPADLTPQQARARRRPLPRHYDENTLPVPVEDADHDRPSLLKIGAIGLGAAAVTALGVLATRAVVDAIAGDDEDRPHPRSRDHLAPRYANLDDRARQDMRSRARSLYDEHDEHAAEIRARAEREARARARQRKERELRRRHARENGRGFLSQLTDSAGKLATNITALVATANSAVDGFHQIAGRAEGMMRDFDHTADRLREFLGERRSPPRPARTAQTNPSSGHPRGTPPDLSPDDLPHSKADLTRDRAHRL